MKGPSAPAGSSAIRRGADTAALAATVALLAATAAGLAAHLWWVFELVTHFRVQLAAAHLLLAAALLTLGRPRWSAAVALLMLPNAWPLVPYLAPGAHAAAGHGTLDVVVVNVEWRNPSAAKLLERIESESPDVVVIVELTEGWADKLRPLFTEYPHRVLQAESDAFGIGILSRHPLDDARIFMLESTPAIDTRIRAPRGSIRLVGVHLRSPTSSSWAAERGRQLAHLAALAAVSDAPLAICGDFNLTPYSPLFAEWTRRSGLRDARAGQGLGITWPTYLPIVGIPIDHCAVSREVGVAGVRRLPAFGSDHYPIAVELFLEDEHAS